MLVIFELGKIGPGEKRVSKYFGSLVLLLCLTNLWSAKRHISPSLERLFLLLFWEFSCPLDKMHLTILLDYVSWLCYLYAHC